MNRSDEDLLSPHSASDTGTRDTADTGDAVEAEDTRDAVDAKDAEDTRDAVWKQGMQRIQGKQWMQGKGGIRWYKGTREGWVRSSVLGGDGVPTAIGTIAFSGGNLLRA